MRHRLVTSRVPVRATAAATWALLENLENHRQLLPGASDWSGDRDSARYRYRLGLHRIRSEVRVVERIPGMRVAEEPVPPAAFGYRRWYKIQADDQRCICQISMECEFSPTQRFFLAPLLRIQMEGFLRRLRAAMEKPR